MKTIHRFFLALALTGAMISAGSSRLSAQSSFSFQLFYDNLSPYGEWVENPDFGYVWIPDVEDDFAPYSNNGYWLYTDAGWTWTSDYEWGWAAFHYGRWYFDPYYGYAWIPGDEWGPGWVTWRRSAGYYGWAPIGPEISISWSNNYGYNQPYNYWRFVRERDFGQRNIFNFYLSTSGNTTIINNSYVINNYYGEPDSRSRYNKGPDRDEVQRYTGTSFKPAQIGQRDKPGQSFSNDRLNIYRPKIEKENGISRKPVPQRTTEWNNGKPQTKNNADSRSRDKNKPSLKSPPEIKERTDRNTQATDQQRNRDDQPGRFPKTTEPAKPAVTRPVIQPANDRTEKNKKPAKQPTTTFPERQPKTEQPVRNERQPATERPIRKADLPKQQRTEQPVRQPQKAQPVPKPVIERPVKNEAPSRQPSSKQPARQIPKEQAPKQERKREIEKPVKNVEPVRLPPERAPSNKSGKEEPVKQGPVNKQRNKNGIDEPLQVIRKEEPVQVPKTTSSKDRNFWQQPDIRETISRPLMPMPVRGLSQPVKNEEWNHTPAQESSAPVKVIPLKKRKMRGITQLDPEELTGNIGRG